MVHRVTERGDIRVQYEGCNNRWTFHPGALTKVNTFAVGDVVRVIHDLAMVRDYQKGHGEWIEVMKGVGHFLCYSYLLLNHGKFPCLSHASFNFMVYL